ncbi:MAG: hypothetical protein R2856_27345 [Caldilineaceae bacterium]
MAPVVEAEALRLVVFVVLVLFEIVFVGQFHAFVERALRHSVFAGRIPGFVVHEKRVEMVVAPLEGILDGKV